MDWRKGCSQHGRATQPSNIIESRKPNERKNLPDVGYIRTASIYHLILRPE